MRYVIAAVLVLLAAGCGGGSGSSGHATKLTPQRQITQAWTSFFSSKTPAADKVKLLQDGRQFQKVIQEGASNPLAKDVAAKVLSVTLQGPSRARVVYTILLRGKPALAGRVGVAVRTGGAWLVGARSFCALLALEGVTAAACPKSS
jgi:hypothetical protein